MDGYVERWLYTRRRLSDVARALAGHLFVW